MSTLVQTNQPVIIPDATPYPVLASDTGKILLIPTLTNDTTINLPAVAPGLFYRFIVTAPATLTHKALVTAVGLINGTAINNVAAAGVNVVYTDQNAVRFFEVGVLGDFCDVYCNGVRWSISAMSSVDSFD